MNTDYFETTTTIEVTVTERRLAQTSDQAKSWAEDDVEDALETSLRRTMRNADIEFELVGMDTEEINDEF